MGRYAVYQYVFYGRDMVSPRPRCIIIHLGTTNDVMQYYAHVRLRKDYEDSRDDTIVRHARTILID